MKYTSVILALYSIFYILVPAASAADISLVVSPPRFDITAEAGELIQKTIKVTNSSDTPLTLRTFTSDFIVEDDAGTPIKVSESASGRYLASPWFTLSTEELTIPAKTSEQLVVIIQVPKDALAGGHYSGVFIEPVPSRDGSQTVSYTSSQVGSLFGITIAGDIKYDALIKDFSTKSDLFEFGPIDFTATIENQSDTHITPKSTIKIHDMLGRELENIELPTLNIFPFTTRTQNGTWDTVWGFGRFTATLSVTYGPNLETSRTIYFWIMPYRLIAAIVVILLVILAVTIAIRRHLSHLADNRDDEIDALKRKIAEMENRGR